MGLFEIYGIIFIILGLFGIDGIFLGFIGQVYDLPLAIFYIVSFLFFK